jgi:hypothetical protein
VSDQDIARLQQEIEERQAKIVQFRQHAAIQKAGDLEAFQKLSPEERMGLYHDAREHWLSMMDLQREQAEKRLAERQGGAS